MKKNGILTEDDKKILNDLYYKTLNILKYVHLRVTQSENQQKDNHVNSWWKHYEEKLSQEIRSLIYSYLKHADITSDEKIIRFLKYGEH
jgi:hypothetical protein